MNDTRISIQNGTRPVILVVPHIDKDVANMVESCASMLDCYTVINNGFIRSKDVDARNDLADCNRIDHVKQPVVQDEFWQPIAKMKRQIEARFWRQNSQILYDKCLIFYVRAFHWTNMRDKDGQEADVVVGYGAGPDPHRDNYTCSLWRRNLFVHLWRATSLVNKTPGDIYVGKRGGKFAGRNPNNINQYYRNEKRDSFVQSMQLSFNRKLLTPKTSLNLAVIIEEMLDRSSFEEQPMLKAI